MSGIIFKETLNNQYDMIGTASEPRLVVAPDDGEQQSLPTKNRRNTKPFFVCALGFSALFVFLSGDFMTQPQHSDQHVVKATNRHGNPELVTDTGGLDGYSPERKHRKKEGRVFSSNEAKNVDPPLEAFLQWKSKHSSQALMAETEPDPDRKFLAGHYSCPDRAGNFIHEFTVALMISIVTNRTLLWSFNDAQLESEKSKEDCDALLQPAQWIPELDHEIQNKYRLVRPKRIQPSFFLTEVPDFRENKGRGERFFPIPEGERWVPLNETQATADHIIIEATWVFYTSETWETWKNGDVILSNNRTYSFNSQLFGFENSTYARQTVDKLFAKGYSYLMGMLRAHSLLVTDAVKESVEPFTLDSEEAERTKRLTYGVHSRHIRSNNDGSDVHHEVNCLDMLLKDQRKAPSQPCTLFIMADRELAVQKLHSAALERNCTPVAVDHQIVDDHPFIKDEKQQETLAEHGPFRGGGFFRDWMTVSQARSGFIHFEGRSSSALVYETMVYNAMVDGNHETPITRCEMEWRKGMEGEWLVKYEDVERLVKIPSEQFSVLPMVPP